MPSFATHVCTNYVLLQHREWSLSGHWSPIIPCCVVSTLFRIYYGWLQASRDHLTLSWFKRFHRISCCQKLYWTSVILYGMPLQQLPHALNKKSLRILVKSIETKQPHCAKQLHRSISFTFPIWEQCTDVCKNILGAFLQGIIEDECLLCDDGMCHYT